jgi:hypothetical protein
MAAIVVDVVVINDGSGGVGADDRHPPPHAAEGRPADNVATVIVGFPPVVRSPAQPLPILLVVIFVVVVALIVLAVVVEQALPLVFPTSPLLPLPLPSRHRPRSNASANPSGSLDMYDPWSARRMPIARSAVLLPDDGPIPLKRSPPSAFPQLFALIFDVGGIGGAGLYFLFRSVTTTTIYQRP